MPRPTGPGGIARHVGGAMLILAATAACGAPGAPAPGVATAPTAASYEEYRVAACAAWDALFLGSVIRTQAPAQI